MGTIPFGEKLNQFQNTSIRNGQMFGKINAEVTKKLSELNSSLVNHVAKDMQMSAVEFMNSKKIGNPWNMMKLNGGGSFLQELDNYQHHLNNAMNEYFEEFACANAELLEDSRAACNEFIELSCKNAPDGMDTFIKPYQNVVSTWFEGAAIVNGLSKSYLDNLKKGISSNEKSSKNIILSDDSSEK